MTLTTAAHSRLLSLYALYLPPVVCDGLTAGSGEGAQAGGVGPTQDQPKKLGVRLGTELQAEHEQVSKTRFQTNAKSGTLSKEQYTAFLIQEYRVHTALRAALEVAAGANSDISKLLSLGETGFYGLLEKDLNALGVNSKELSDNSRYPIPTSVEETIKEIRSLQEKKDTSALIGYFHTLIAGLPFGGRITAGWIASIPEIGRSLPRDFLSKAVPAPYVREMLNPVINGITDAATQDRVIEGAKKAFDNAAKMGNDPAYSSPSQK